MLPVMSTVAGIQSIFVYVRDMRENPSKLHPWICVVDGLPSLACWHSYTPHVGFAFGWFVLNSNQSCVTCLPSP